MSMVGVGLWLKRRKEELVAQVLGNLALNAKDVAQLSGISQVKTERRESSSALRIVLSVAFSSDPETASTTGCRRRRFLRMRFMCWR